MEPHVTYFKALEIFVTNALWNVANKNSINSCLHIREKVLSVHVDKYIFFNPRETLIKDDRL